MKVSHLNVLYSTLTKKNSFSSDIDSSGTIDYGEFLAATLHPNNLERGENLLSAFAFFDNDGSGYNDPRNGSR